MSTDDQALLEFAEVTRTLRERCAWKAEQTHRSLQRYLLEETYEALEAIDEGESTNDWSHLREELGDVLLQVYFHAVIAEGRAEFTLGEVAGDAVAKMRRRNPHVFGDVDGSTLSADEAIKTWEAAKARERPRPSITDGIPRTLPALLVAEKVWARLAQAGSPPALTPESPRDSGVSERIGGELLAVVARAHEAGVDPEQALRDAVRRLVAASAQQPPPTE